MAGRDYTPCDDVWEAILDLIEANTPPRDDDDDEDTDAIIEILSGK